MVNNIEPIKNYIYQYIYNDDIVFNVRGIFRIKDLPERIQTNIHFRDIDLVDLLVHDPKKLDEDLLEKYFQLFPTCRFYFNPCPISKNSLANFKINPNCFHFLPAAILNNPIIFPHEYPGCLLDIDDMEDYNPIIEILKENNVYEKIALDIPSVSGKHVFIKDVKYKTISKLKSQTEGLHVTFKTKRNFVLMKSLMSS